MLKASSTLRFVGLMSALAVIIGGLLPAFALSATVYETDFNSLSIGETQPFPGDTGQDGWYTELAEGDAFGEIQDVTANGGKALHEFAPSTNSPGLQTIVKRDTTPPDLNVNSIITLSFDFYAHSSDLDAVNNFIASMSARGGPHPGYEIITVHLGGGNGEPKTGTGVNVVLSHFNGVDNNAAIPLTVGQGLEWDTWHHVEVSIDHGNDTYLYVTVNSQTENLNGYQPPRSYDDDSSQWLRGQLVESIEATIIPDDVGGVQTDDDIYWDNLSLSVYPPTLVELVSFTAESGDDGAVTLSWETATEVDNAGFNIYRSRLKDGNYKKLNNALIPSEGNEVEGASYSYEDTPGKGTFYYKLEDVDYDETRTMHGPVRVRVRK